MQEKGKVLLVVPSLCLGGQERVAVKTAEMLNDTYNVTIAIFSGKNAVYTPACRVIDFNVHSVPGKLGKINNLVKRVAMLRRLRRKKNYDIVYSFGFTANIANVLSGTKGKSIVGVRTYDEKIDAISKYIYRRSDHIIACSELIRSHIASEMLIDEKKISLLYNPIDVDEIYKKSQEEITDYCFNKTTIISHGRLDEVKNWPRLIKAFSIVKKTIRDINLLIIGEGSERKHLEELISQLGIENDVSLLGFRNNPFKYLANSDIYVLSSYSEGFPNSLIEGMAFLPSISTDCKSGPREIMSITNKAIDGKDIEYAEYGILVCDAIKREKDCQINEDDIILSEAIKSLLQNPSLMQTYKEKARTRIAQFGCKEYTEKLNSIFFNV